MSGRLPYAIAVIDGLFLKDKGSIPLRDMGLRSFVKLGAEQTGKSTYGKPRGALESLSVALGKIVGPLKQDGSNYRTVLREWMGTFMHGIMSYSPSGYVRVDVTLERYLKLFEEYETIFHQAFVADSVSADNNYENLEFLGDGVYKNALVFFLWRELGIQNKTISTTLKHSHENTKALSDLARIFHMDALARSDGSKHPDALIEDVFEAVVGVLQTIQWEIQRDPSSPEHAALTTDCGFANRLVRLIFNCSDAKYEYSIPPKTFITTLEGMFRDASEKMKSTATQTADRHVIVFRTPPSIISRMALRFGSNAWELTRILNCTFESTDTQVSEKHFSATVHEKLITLLAGQGITYQSVQNHKNHLIAPPEFHKRLDILAQKAAAKGFWLGLVVSAASRKGAGRLIVDANLYHNDPRRPLQRVRQESLGTNDRSLYTQLLDDAERLIDKAQKIDEKWHPGSKELGGFKMTGDVDADAPGIQVPSHARAPIAKAPWAADAARTIVDSGTILHSAVAGNAVAPEAPNARALTLVDMFAEYYVRQKKATLRHDLLVTANTDERTAKGLLLEISEKTTTTAVLSPDESGKGYAVSFLAPPKEPGPPPKEPGYSFSVEIYGTPPGWLKGLYERLRAKISISPGQLDASAVIANLTNGAPADFLQKYASVIKGGQRAP